MRIQIPGYSIIIKNVNNNKSIRGQKRKPTANIESNTRSIYTGI